MSIFLINPFVLSPITAIIRNYFASGYNAGRITTTSTAYQTAATVSTTETASTDYVAFWQATTDQSSTTADVRAQLVETSVRQLSNIEPQDTTDAFSMGGLYPYAGGTNKTFTVQYSTESGTAGIAGRVVNVLELDPSDQWAYNSGTTTGTAGGAAAVSITVSTPGNVYIIVSGMVDAAGNAALSDGTTLYGTLNVAMNQDATTWSPYVHIQKFNVTTSTTFSLSVLGTGSQVRTASILALREDKFENVYYYTQGDGALGSSTTSTVFVDGFGAGTSFNLVNPQNYHLILGTSQMWGTSTGASTGTRLHNETRNISYNIEHFREMNATTERYPTFAARITNFASSTANIRWQYRCETTATVVSQRYSRIAIFDLGILGPPIAFVGSETIVNSTSIPIPTLTEPGDIVIVASHSTSTAQNLPTGFTNGGNGTTLTVNYRWSYKFMADPVDTTVTGLTATADTKHIVMVFRDVDSASPPTAATASGTGATLDPPSVSINDATTNVIVAIGFLDDDSVLADVTPPSGYTLAAAEEATGTIMGAYKRIAQGTGTTLTEDPGAFGIGAGTDDWVAVTIALKQL